MPQISWWTVCVCVCSQGGSVSSWLRHPPHCLWKASQRPPAAHTDSGQDGGKLAGGEHTTYYSVSHHASPMLPSDRWRLVERSCWWWMCVVCWAGRSAALQPSLTLTCYVCSLLWSNCTQRSRCTAFTNAISRHLAVLISMLTVLVSFRLRRWLLCRRVWKASADRATSRTPGCLDFFVMHRWGHFIKINSISQFCSFEA